MSYAGTIRLPKDVQMPAKSAEYYDSLTAENPGIERPGDVMPMSMTVLRARKRALREGRLKRETATDWRKPTEDMVVLKEEAPAPKPKKKASGGGKAKKAKRKE
jgi:hypothetical protein